MNGLPPVNSQKRWRDAAVLALLVIAMGVPFSGQPFHMDDSLYMDLARNALRNPLYPNDMPYVFEGKTVADLGSHSHPPFQTYFLALILWMFGEGAGREWIYHSISLIFPLLAVLSFYFLSLRFLARPLSAAILFACSPVLLVMEHNLMTDVPNLAFWLASIATFVHASDNDSPWVYVVSSLLQFCAMFTSYPSLALTPLLGFYHYRCSNKVRGWIALSVPLVLMTLWFSMSCVHYGRFLLAQTAAYVQRYEPWSLWKLAVKCGAVLQYQGWLVVFPVFLLPTFVFSLRRARLLGAVVMSVLATWFASGRYSLSDRLIYALGILVGLAVLSRVATLPLHRSDRAEPRLGWTDTERYFLCWWYLGVTACCILLYVGGSARYILPLIPPIVIYFCRVLEVEGGTQHRGCPSDRGHRAVLNAAIVFTAIWGLALSHADFEFASIYPRAARDFAAIAGHTESYYGGEWGFRYYFGRAGLKQMKPDGQPLPAGCLLVRPGLALPYELSKEALAASTLLHERAYRLKSPLRLLDAHSTAGFYDTHWGKLPFSLSWDSQETIDIRLFLSSADHSTPGHAPVSLERR